MDEPRQDARGYIIEKETLEKALKPFDVVSDSGGNVGFISEVSVNRCQPSFSSQIGYRVTWLVDRGDKSAWWCHSELTLHCNLFIKIAEAACHPMGRNRSDVQELFNNMNR